MDNKYTTILHQEKENINNITISQNQEIKDLKDQLLKNQNEINDIKLRALASLENIKKNTKEKIKNIQKTELEQFLKTILPIIDSLEDILILSDSLKLKDQPLIEGIALTLQSLLNIIYKLGVKIEGKKNEIFNPQLHTAISIEKSLNTLPNHIISIQKHGFTLNQILLRKAMVIVAKK